MFKKIKEFLFGKPAALVEDTSWVKAKELSDVLTAVAAKKEATVQIETILTVAPTPTKKKRTYVKRDQKVDPPVQWPFPVTKPSEGVTLAELEALRADPVKPAAMKARTPRKAAIVPKQD
jgi:hypothetical protein